MIQNKIIIKNNIFFVIAPLYESMHLTLIKTWIKVNTTLLTFIGNLIKFS